MKQKSPANAGKKQSSQWKKGQSGNPKGKARGTRNKATIAAQVLLDGEAEKLTRKAVEMALGGNMAALKLCLERLVPPARELPINFELPDTNNSADLSKVTGALLAAVASGSILPGQAAQLAKVIENHRSAVELEEVDQRLQRLEEAFNAKKR